MAYIVCETAGLAAGGYSFGYVAHWSAGDRKTIKDSAERVMTCARTVLDRAGLLEPAEQREAA